MTGSYVAQIGKMAGRSVQTRDKTIFKVTETTADGREIVKYTDKKPTP